MPRCTSFVLSSGWSKRAGKEAHKGASCVSETGIVGPPCGFWGMLLWNSCTRTTRRRGRTPEGQGL